MLVGPVRVYAQVNHEWHTLTTSVDQLVPFLGYAPPAATIAAKNLLWYNFYVQK